MFTVTLIKQGGKLIYPNDKSKLKYEIFVDKLNEGQEIEMFMDLTSSDATTPQIAKVHACIRELAKESGYNFEEMKFIIKQRSGLCYRTKAADVCKSFADCSKDEIALAIEACIAIGRDNYNMDLT